MADDVDLLVELSLRVYAWKVLALLDQAWPESVMLDRASVTEGATTGSSQTFHREVQMLVDRGLMQYDACIVSSVHGAVFYVATITQRGRDLMRHWV